MKIRKYSYILCMFAAMVGIMTACASDEQEEMFPGEGEPVTVKLSIDTRAAGADDFESQVKTLRVYAFHNSATPYFQMEAATRRSLVLCGGQ